MPNLGDRPIAVVGHRLDQHRHAADAVAFVSDFLVIHAFEFARAAFDGAVNRVVRHILRLRVRYGFSQTRVRVNIARPAGSGGDRDFFNQLGENLPALRVQCAFFVFDRMPLGMSRH